MGHLGEALSIFALEALGESTMKRKMLEAAAGEIMDELFSAERQVEAAIGSVAKMALTITSAREASGLAIHHGQDALDRLAKTMASVVAARGHVCDLHNVLDIENKSLGEPVKAVGPGGKPPEEFMYMLRDAA